MRASSHNGSSSVGRVNDDAMFYQLLVKIILMACAQIAWELYCGRNVNGKWTPLKLRERNAAAVSKLGERKTKIGFLTEPLLFKDTRPKFSCSGYCCPSSRLSPQYRHVTLLSFPVSVAHTGLKLEQHSSCSDWTNNSCKVNLLP